MICKKCGCEHDGSFGKGIFCSAKCRSSYAGLRSDRKKQSEASKRNGTIWNVIALNKQREDEKKKIKEDARLKKNHFCEKCGEKHDGLFGSGRYCSSFCAHKREWSEEKKKKQSDIAKKSDRVLSFNKNRAKNRIFKDCLVCGSEMTLFLYEKDKRKFCSKECQNEGARQKLYKTGSGGYRKGSGHGKCGWYKGIQCDSSYELAWVIYHLEHGIKFERNKLGFEYEYDGKKRKYYPDFYLTNEKRYVEIKGFRTAQHDAKVAAFKANLTVLYKTDLADVFKYVIGKYGKNFIELYDENPHKRRKNKCLKCGKPAISKPKIRDACS